MSLRPKVVTKLSNHEGLRDVLLLMSNTDIQYKCYSNINNQKFRVLHTLPSSTDGPNCHEVGSLGDNKIVGGGG